MLHKKNCLTILVTNVWNIYRLVRDFNHAKNLMLLLVLRNYKKTIM